MAPVDSKRYRSNPYFFLFHCLVGQMVQHPHRANRAAVVNFFFDRQDEFWKTAQQIYGFMKAERDYKYLSRLGALTYCDKADPIGVPIQAADLFAYEVYKFLAKSPEQRMRPQAAWLFDPMYKRGLLSVKEWNEAGITELYRVSEEFAKTQRGGAR